MSHKTYVPTFADLGGFFILATIAIGLLVLGISALREPATIINAIGVALCFTMDVMFFYLAIKELINVPRNPPRKWLLANGYKKPESSDEFPGYLEYHNADCFWLMVREWLRFLFLAFVTVAVMVGACYATLSVTWLAWILLTIPLGIWFIWYCARELKWSLVRLSVGGPA